MLGPLNIETVSQADIETGTLNTSWVPHIEQPFHSTRGQNTRTLREDHYWNTGLLRLPDHGLSLMNGTNCFRI